MKKVKALTLALIIFISCKEKCNECFTPPQPILFEFVNQTEDSNLISNGTYTSKDIKVIDKQNNQSKEFSIISDGDNDLVSINTIGWSTETIHYDITAKDKPIFTLKLNAERITEDCCSHTVYSNIQIENSAFEIDPNTGVYQIFVE